MTTNNLWCVYKHTTPSGKVYIGIAKDVKHRWRGNGSGYKGSTRISNAIKKYGWDNIKHEILFSNLTKEEACQKEIDLIKQFNSTNPAFGYNLLSGGQCGLHSKETKEKIQKSNMGHSVSESVRKRLSVVRSVPVICLDTNKVYESAKIAAEELNICNSSIGKVCNGKAQQAGGLRFAKLEDYKNNTIPKFEKSCNSSKRIVCVTTGEVFRSETEAAKKYGVTSQAISHACTGKVKTCCGLAWTEEKRPDLMDIPARLENEHEQT